MVFKRGKHFKAILAAVLAVGVSGGLTACSKMLTGDVTTGGASYTVFGKVVDAQTGAGIGDAKVYIKVNGTWQSATTSKGGTVVVPAQQKVGLGAAETSDGDWSISGLPAMPAGAPIIVQPPKGSSLVQLSGVVPAVSLAAIGSSGGNQGNYSVDIGQTALSLGVTITVHVVDGATGNYVQMPSSAAIPVTLGINGCNFSGAVGCNSFENVFATQDATDKDKYTIVVPNNFGNTTLTVPALDNNADGKIDYTTGASTVATNAGSLAGQGTLTTNIVVQPITSTTALAVVASNAKTQTVNAVTTSGIPAAGPIKVLYNMPVTIAGTATDSVTLSYTDNFKTLTSAAVAGETTVTAALSTDGTVLTVTPAAALTENKTYTLRATLKDPAGTQTAVSSGFYVYATGTGTLGSTPTAVTVDNANYWTGGAVITTGDTTALGAGNPNIVFPELVWGTIRVISGTSWSAVSPVSLATAKALTGTLTFAGATANATGGTTLTSQLNVGDTIVMSDGATYTVQAAPAPTATTLTLSASPAAGTYTAVITARAAVVLTAPASSGVLTAAGTLGVFDIAGGDTVQSGNVIYTVTVVTAGTAGTTAGTVTVTPAGPTAGLNVLASAFRRSSTVVANSTSVTLGGAGGTAAQAITYLSKIAGDSVNVIGTFGNTAGYNTSGAAYTVDLTLAPVFYGTMRDGDSLTLGINVVDMEGNAYNVETAFPVK